MTSRADIRDFVAERLSYYVGTPRAGVPCETRLTHDLRMVGDDAYYFLCDLQDEFSIEFIDFDFSKFFVREDKFTILWYIIPGIWRRHARRCTPLTINHIIDVCERQKWFDPE